MDKHTEATERAACAAAWAIESGGKEFDGLGYRYWMGWQARASQAPAPSPKPFPAPGEWFPVGVLGHPMREYAPGKWESARWPSEQAAPSPAASIEHDHVFQEMIADWNEFIVDGEINKAHTQWKRMCAHIDAHCARLIANASKMQSLAEAQRLVQRISDDRKERESRLASQSASAKDAERLDFLDGNAKFRMGWEVTASPVGSLRVQAIITGGKPIREAIDAARAAMTRAER